MPSAYPLKLANGNLVVPVRAESEDGTTIGDGLAEIGPDHPDFAKWVTDMKRLEDLELTKHTSGRRVRRTSKTRNQA